MLILEFEEHRTNEEGKEIFESCDWWKELVSRAAQDADRFEVRCWEDEQEGIAFGQQYGQKAGEQHQRNRFCRRVDRAGAVCAGR